MPYSSMVLRVLIASPSDVSQERDAVSEVVSNWDVTHGRERGITFLPVRWEQHATPELGDRPQAILNRQIVDDSDLLVGVFWTRIGTWTGESESGTVEEIERFQKAGKPVLLYFSSAPIDPSRIDSAQYDRLRAFRAKVEASGLVDSFATLEQLREKLWRHLSNVAGRCSELSLGALASPGPTVPRPAPLSDDHLKVLTILAQSEEDLEAEEIAHELKMGVQKTRYYIDQLVDRKCVGTNMVVGRPTRYYLGKQGRALLGERNML